MFRTSRIGRFINQNLFRVIVAIIAIAFVIVLIQILNNIEKNKNKSGNTIETNTIIAESIYKPEETTISGSNVDNEESEINNKTIDNFFQLSNEGKVQEAYNLISNECKEVYFPTLDEYINNYHSQVFKVQKTYSIQSWINDNNRFTYKVRILDDMLATGSYNNSNVIEDYYTVVQNDDEIKLNVNGYIGREELNYTKEENNINVDVKYKNIYKNYEEYVFNIKNKSENTIVMDSKETTNYTYLVGNSNTIYSSYIHEIDISELIIESGQEKEITIKFNKQYNPERGIKGVVFSDIILNYNNYVELEDKSNYEDRMKLQLY